MSTAARELPVVGRALGRVLRCVDGVVEVLTDTGPVVATLGGAALAGLAADPGSRPAPGDLVTLTRWPDGPVTIDRLPGRWGCRPAPARAGDGVVVPLRRR